jgi:hypothetical protein
VIASLIPVAAGAALGAKISEFPLPTPGSGPSGIVAGPDGALWFVETTLPGKIGRITTTGHVSEFPTPTANSGREGIATGRDGAVWFTEQGGNAIGRLLVVPTKRKECQRGGWRNLVSDHGRPFSDRADCTRFVGRHHDTRSDR